MATAKKPRKTKTKKSARRRATPGRAAPQSTRVAHAAALVQRAEAGVARNRKKAQALIKQIRALLDRIEADFHRLGLLLVRLSDKAMYTSVGHDSFAKLLKKEKLLPATTAYKMMAVAEAFNARDVKKVGAAKAYALLSYAEATPATDVARELALPNARIGRRAVSNMTVRDIDEAAKKVRKASGQRRPRTGDEERARAAARKLQASLRKQGHKTAKAKANRRDGRWEVSLTLSTGDAEALAL